MIAQFRMLVSVLFLFGFAVSPSAENVRVNLEEPRDAALYSGISNLRGWAVAESGIAAIEIDIDGTYAFNVPMGGARGDVANAYPDYPDSDLSGFSMAFNYKGLESGEHVVTARAISNDGNIATRDATINVARFVSSYISDVEQIDTGTVSEVTTDGQSIALKDIAVEGQKWDITLSFDTATQGFALTEISSAAAGGGNTACTSAWQSGDYTLERDGVTRSFRVHVPDNPGIAGPYPMVVVFHGWGGTRMSSSSAHRSLLRPMRGAMWSSRRWVWVARSPVTISPLGLFRGLRLVWTAPPRRVKFVTMR